MRQTARLAGLLASCVLLYAGAARPVFLLTDCGNETDDQWVVAHLAVSPEFDLRGIVTTHTGKHKLMPAPEAESSARRTRDVLDHLKLAHRPDVLAGSSVPLTTRSPLRNSGVERLIEESKPFNTGKRLPVLSIGAATDLASALMADPGLADRIEVVAMGFESWEAGGAEFNVENDPISWQVILDSRVPVVIGDGAVCKRDLLMSSQRAHTVANNYLADILDHWLQNDRSVVVSVTGNPDVWPVWDEVTVAHLLGFTTEAVRERPRLKDDLKFAYGANPGTVRWVTAVKSDRLWSDLQKKVRR